MASSKAKLVYQVKGRPQNANKGLNTRLVNGKILIEDAHCTRKNGCPARHGPAGTIWMPLMGARGVPSEAAPGIAVMVKLVAFTRNTT
jgi:hypothetical protein